MQLHFDENAVSFFQFSHTRYYTKTLNHTLFTLIQATEATEAMEVITITGK